MSAADWKPYDVPGLAGLLAEQPTDSGTHAMAWQQAYETLTDQRQRIEAARAVLIQAWPATPGGAAGLFFDEVDALTQAMGATAESAVDAHGALTGIVTAVDGATTKVDTLHQSWQQNQATIGGAVPTEDWTRPLNGQAHTVMGQADAAIAEHATQLVAPAPYIPQIRIETLNPLQPAAGRSTLTRTATEQSRGEVGAAAAPLSPNLQDDGSATPSGNKTQISTPTPRQMRSTPLLTESPAKGATNGINTSESPGASSDGVAPGGAADPSTDDAGSGEFANSSEFAVRQSRPMALGTDPEVANSSGDRDSIAGLSNGRAGGLASDRLAVFPANRGRFGTSGRPNSTMEGTLGDPRTSMSTYGAAAPNPGSTSRSLGPDGTIVPGNSGYGSHTMSAGLSDSAEPMPFGSIVSSGSSPSRSSGGRDAAGRDHVEWTMPRGVPPVIEAQLDRPVHHDPGTGVIGIDR